MTHRARLLGIALIATGAFACSFRGLPLVNDGDGGVLFEDAPAPDAYIPDAGPCMDTGKTCAGPILRTCQMVNQFPPDEETCNLGCLSASGPPRCGRLQPSGGVLVLKDLEEDPALLGDRKGTGSGVINTDDGSITGVRGAGPDVVDGIRFAVRTLPDGRKVGVFRVRKLTLEGSWDVRGANALAIASLTDIDIKGRLDVRGDCNGTTAGPGGFPGGEPSTAAAGSGGGAAGQGGGMSSSGAGGGAYGDLGGDGGKQGPGRPAGGARFGDETITALVGGGGGGGGANGGRGGGGGGAVQLAANGKVTVEAAINGSLFDGINAGGCGGAGGGNKNGGGGGGAGGTILVEAKTFVLDNAVLVVNGGAGGGGNSNSGGDPGDWSTNTARGGTGANGGGSGGRGGAAGNRPGGRGGDAKEGGGGGGGVGRIRVNTLDAQGIQLKGSVAISPTFGEGNTTSTKGAANIQ